MTQGTDGEALRVSAWIPETRVLGPGSRVALWVQGCPLACPSCLSPDTHAATGGKLLPVEWLVDRISAVDGVDGLTISGGEPFAQAGVLATLIEQLRERTSWTFWCYSGYELEYLQRRGTTAQQRLLNLLDVLIDGPYVRALHTAKRWRGSSNQRVWFLSGRDEHVREMLADEGVWLEPRIDPDGSIQYVGIPPIGLIESLSARLRQRGILVSPAE